jgi:hypothetical protein
LMESVIGAYVSLLKYAAGMKKRGKSEVFWYVSLASWQFHCFEYIKADSTIAKIKNNLSEESPLTSLRTGAEEAYSEVKRCIQNVQYESK